MLRERVASMGQTPAGARGQDPLHPAARAGRQVYVEEGAGEVWELDGVVWKSRQG
jgi:hypothetical protein